MPAINKANMLRGAFGNAFRRLCCVPQCASAQSCPLAQACPYKTIFEPSPPPNADRLSKNQDVPRPFVFRAPLNDKTRFEPGEEFAFGLVLIGRALDHLPYFVLSFRELAAQGLGLNRAKCELKQVVEDSIAPRRHGEAAWQSLNQMQNNTTETQRRGENQQQKLTTEGTEEKPRTQRNAKEPVDKQAEFGQKTKKSETSATEQSGEQIIFDSADQFEVEVRSLCSFVSSVVKVFDSTDQVFHSPRGLNLDQWIKLRIQQLAIKNEGSADHPITRSPGHRILIRFVTPTWIKSANQVVRKPDFAHIFKRLRDRINALSTFFGSGPLDVDFAGLGQRAEGVRTVSCNVRWEERFRTSSKTHQRHELSGFVGEAVYEGNLNEFLSWLVLGELVHLGKHTAWGMGQIQLKQQLTIGS